MSRANYRATLLLSTLLACGPPVDPQDALFFADAEVYVPQGLLCGLAYEGGYGYHIGGSCMGDYDPALEYLETSEIIVAPDKSEEEDCPEGTYRERLNDHDSPRSDRYGSGKWSTCSAQGNGEKTSADVRDLPAGAVCGIGVPDSLDEGYWVVECDYHKPSNLDCPDGMEPRWIPDVFTDGVDENCLPDDSFPLQSQANALYFCAVKDDVGCHSGDCLAPALYEGLICGLHARGDLVNYLFQSPGQAADALNLDQDGQVLSVRFDASLYEYYVTSWYEPCAPHDQAIADRLDFLRVPVSPPTCMGKDISDGVCPEGLEMVCAPGWHGDSDAANVSYTAMCWCTSPGAYQQLAEFELGQDSDGGTE